MNVRYKAKDGLVHLRHPWSKRNEAPWMWCEIVPHGNARFNEAELRRVDHEPTCLRCIAVVAPEAS